jgi:hypothetical protein
VDSNPDNLLQKNAYMRRGEWSGCKAACCSSYRFIARLNYHVNLKMLAVERLESGRCDSAVLNGSGTVVQSV